MKFVTSPYLFIHPSFNNSTLIDINSNQCYSDVNITVFDIITFFLIPKTKRQAINEGYSLQDINECIDLNFLIGNSNYQKASSMWEKYNWQRAAFLTFSQQNLKYSESINEKSTIKELTTFRRNLLREYDKEFSYPEQLFIVSNDEILLNKPAELSYFDFNLIANRKSVRKFTGNPLPYEKFVSVLYNSTKYIREIEETKNEIYFLLNSFYSWLNIYIAVQKVENIESGYYQYNPLKHSLLKIGNEFKSKDILTCVQGQHWIAGSGFCLFFVVQWERYQWLYRHSRAYINLLIQLGDIGQEFIFNASLNEIGGWMTPAVNESYAAKLLNLDSKKQTPMYFMKIGVEK